MTRFAIYDTPLGAIRIEHIGGRLVTLKILTDEVEDMGARDDLSDSIFAEIMEYLHSERTHFTTEIDISRCTPFQQSVYAELLKIPYGELRTYKEIATAIGNPNASRAVGTANNRNPIAIIIPCHRVIGSNGAMVGYATGLKNKEHLLKIESHKPEIEQR